MKEETSVFYNERSYQACVAMAWRTVFNGYRAVLKYAWPQVVLSGAGIALIAFLLFVYYQWLTPTALVVLGILLLFYGLATAMWQSAAYVQMDFFRADGGCFWRLCVCGFSAECVVVGGRGCRDSAFCGGWSVVAIHAYRGLFAPSCVRLVAQ